MAKSNRGRNGRNNRNQHGGIMSTARDNPLAAAAAVGGAVAAGVFLWARRSQISDQISNLADQMSEWREGMGSEDDLAPEDTTSGEHSTASRSRLAVAAEPRRRSLKKP